MPDSNFYVPLPKELLAYPAARTLRRTFPQKLKDTFYAFAGKRPGWKGGNTTNPGRLGIFDYVTFGIPRLVSKVLFSVTKIDHMDIYRFTLLLKFVPWLLAMVFELARYLAAAAATIVVSPVVLAIHGISWLVGHEQYLEALRIQGQDNQTLQIYLEGNNISDDELRLTKINATETLDARLIELEFTKKEKPQTQSTSSGHESSSSGSSTHSSASGNPPFPPFVVKLTQQKVGEGYGEISQKQTLHALMNLNMFKAYSRTCFNDSERQTSKLTVCNDARTLFRRCGGETYWNEVNEGIKIAILPNR